MTVYLCPQCEGCGHVKRTCPSCGSEQRKICPVCNGFGHYVQQQSTTVAVPPISWGYVDPELKPAPEKG